jgi:hypothetical protein
VKHGFLTVNGTAAGGHDAAGRGYTEQIALFDASKPCDAVGGDDLLQIKALSGLHENIRIYERYPQALGQKHSDGAFAGTRHADEDHVWFSRHGSITLFSFSHLDDCGVFSAAPCNCPGTSFSGR